MILDNQHTWSVSVTFPPGSPDSKGAARRWAHNDIITVVADTAARAIEMVIAQWPVAKVWTVNHVGSRTILMVDGGAQESSPWVKDMRRMLDLIIAGGWMISTAKCTEQEIAWSRAEGRMFVEPSGLGYIVRPPASFPRTAELPSDERGKP